MEAYFANRLLDLAHSRYRPGVALRYKQVDTSRMDIKEIKKCRQTTYIVVEEVKQIEELEYIVDMELGVCSCPKGSIGAACKHQAAVAKNFNIASVNIAPIHSKEARMQYAVLATGNALNEEFYAHLTDTSDKQETKSSDSAYVVKTAQLQDNLANSDENKGDTLTNDDATATSDVSNPCSSWQEQVLGFKTALDDVVKDNHGTSSRGWRSQYDFWSISIHSDVQKHGKILSSPICCHCMLPPQVRKS